MALKSLQLYFVLKRPDVPIWAKSTIIGALGYFISPLDAIPDVIAGVGFTDDASVLAAHWSRSRSYRRRGRAPGSRGAGALVARVIRVTAGLRACCRRLWSAKRLSQPLDDVGFSAGRASRGRREPLPGRYLCHPWQRTLALPCPRRSSSEDLDMDAKTKVYIDRQNR
ncbi:YkvA family protein [Salinicola tamaricis]|uniref:YkvA family protein n=1 Tax=Salinicola tamaricis TaxID=1771309 RepID=UPI0013E99FC7|nr:YkvA family protein [Salinicola tamaricis]